MWSTLFVYVVGYLHTVTASSLQAAQWKMAGGLLYPDAKYPSKGAKLMIMDGLDSVFDDPAIVLAFVCFLLLWVTHLCMFGIECFKHRQEIAFAFAVSLTFAVSLSLGLSHTGCLFLSRLMCLSHWLSLTLVSWLLFAKLTLQVTIRYHPYTETKSIVSQ